MPASSDRLRAWIALVRLPRTNARERRRLVDSLGDPVEWIDEHRGVQLPALPEWLRRHRPSLELRISQLPWRSIDAEVNWLLGVRAHLTTWLDSDFPPLLREVSDPPLVLFCRGQVACLTRPMVAIVGARRPTYAGREAARRLSRDLAQAGVGVVSGLALGVDAAAHEGALEGGGDTVAVLGSGLSNVYPARNRGLAERIAEHGVVVSEFTPHTRPARHHFPHRNRIISGLSLGVAVVEAASRSGSLITARLAGEQGRDVFAMPGSVRNPLSRGCHRLIREGAALIEGAADVLEELGGGWGRLAKERRQGPGESGSRARVEPKGPAGVVLACVDYDSTAVDNIVTRSGLTPDIVSSMLLALELEGLIRADASGGFTRA